MPLPPATSITSRARRPKNAWFFYSSKLGESYEIGIGYKNSKGEGAPYSSCSKSVHKKIPFGPPTKCEYVVRKDNSGEMVNEFQFKNNRRESAGCNEILLNNFETSKDNLLNVKITTLYIEGKKKLLANYVSATQSSKDFFFHSELYDNDGLSLEDNVRYDGSNVKLEEIISNGGSLEELREFIKLCRDCAVFGESRDLVNEEVFKKFRKLNKRIINDPTKVVKLSKRARTDANEKAELEDPEGLEKKYQSLYVNLVKIKLENISLSKSLGIVPNNFRVNSIAQNIKYRYDPSQAILVVAPDASSEGAKPYKFVVVQKIHTFEAFRLLDRTGDFEKLCGHQERNVMCYVINTDSIALMRYGNSRANDIGQQVGRKTTPQDLLHIFDTLTANEGRGNASKVVERMSRLTRIGPNEDTALRKLWRWQQSSYGKLMEVIRGYEAYETTDVKTSHVAATISRGDKLTIPNKLIIDLAKMDETYFEENYRKVLNRESSLRSLINDFKKVKELKQVYGTLCQISGYKSLDDLKLQYPEKVNEDVMSKFVGADIESKNLKGKMLVNYYQEVATGLDSKEIIPIEFKTVSYIDDALLESVVSENDVVMLFVKEPLKHLYLTLIRKIFQSSRLVHCGMIIFPSEVTSFETISYLRNQSRSLIENFRIIPLTFSDNSVRSTNDIAENIIHAVVFGTFSVLSGPLAVHYNSLNKFPLVLAKTAPPKSRVAVVNGPGVTFVEVHDKESTTHIVKYYGVHGNLEMFEKSLRKGGAHGEENGEDPSTSKQSVSCVTDKSKQDGSITSPLKLTDTSTYSQDSGVDSQENTPFENLRERTPLKMITFRQRLDQIAYEEGFD